MDPRDELLSLCADLRDEVESWRAVGWERLAPGAPPGLGEAPAWEGGIVVPARPAAPPVSPRAPAPVPALASPPPPPPAPRPGPALLPENPLPLGAPVAPAAGGGLFGARWGAVMADPQEPLRELAREAEACRACARCTSRRSVVFGGGPVKGLLILAPAPSAGEDAEGRPFVGEAGAMLDRMLVNVLALERADVHIAPVVLCGGAEPLPSELAACRSWLDRRLALVEPRVVLVMGRPVARVLGLDAPAGTWQRWTGRDALVTAHPDEILREPALRRDVFEHLKEVRRRLG